MSRLAELHTRLDSFVRNECIPAEAQWMRAIDESGPRRWDTVPDVLEKLQARAKVLGLFNLFLPAEFEGGPGLSLTEYAPLCELMGWSPLAAEACNCSAPGAKGPKASGRASGRDALIPADSTRSRHGKHGGPYQIRICRAASSVADPAARGTYPLCVPHDRTRRR